MSPTSRPAETGSITIRLSSRRSPGSRLQFGKPVLLINGDSHIYETDHPLANPASVRGKIHNTPAVPNLTRITVQGSTNKPAEWLKLTIDPSKSQPFSWVNVPYCIDPLAACQ